MRVKIEHSEVREGLIFTKIFHEVHLTVDFTHEEKQIIRQRGLAEQVLLERVPPDARETDDPNWYALKVGHLLTRRPDRFRLANPADAKLYAEKLTEVLHGMKLWLDENAAPAGTTAFEI